MVLVVGIYQCRDFFTVFFLHFIIGSKFLEVGDHADDLAFTEFFCDFNHAFFG